MKSSPVRLLVEMLLGAMAIGGFLYGMHWKTRVVDQDGSQLKELRSELEALEKQNLILLERLDTEDQQP